MVFQNYALYPHMTVYDNIAFALQIARMPKPEIERRVREVAKTLQLDPYLGRRPGQLSGGQRQRVAMGRAIVREPAVFLMDEPLSNLDAKLRVQMRSEIARIQDRLGVTTVYVTHDQVEAMTMGDRVALMKDGVLQQVDAPSRIYGRPANTFVASFIGSPGMNLYHASLADKEADGAMLQLGSHRLRVPEVVFQQRPDLAGYIGREVIAGIRPEDMEDLALVPGHPGDQTITAEVYLSEALGPDNIVHFNIDAPVAEVVDPDTLSDISKSLDDGKTSACVARFDAKSGVGPAQRWAWASIAAGCNFSTPRVVLPFGVTERLSLAVGTVGDERSVLGALQQQAPIASIRAIGEMESGVDADSQGVGRLLPFAAARIEPGRAEALGLRKATQAQDIRAIAFEIEEEPTPVGRPGSIGPSLIGHLGGIAATRQGVRARDEAAIIGPMHEREGPQMPDCLPGAPLEGIPHEDTRARLHGRLPNAFGAVDVAEGIWQSAVEPGWRVFMWTQVELRETVRRLRTLAF